MLVYTLKQILPRRVWEWLKRARQRILGRRAYMNPSYSIEGEDRIVRTLLWRKHDKGFYVDVGAHHPFRFSNTYLFYTQGWSGINIDATPGSMKAFNKYRPRDINLEVGVGRGRKTGGGELCKDSALGNHSADLVDFGTTADHKSSSAPKSTKNYESNTAIPRILEEENQSSSRAAQSGVAIHKKVDSTSEAQNLKMPAKDSRIFESQAQKVGKSQAQANLDSSKSPSDSKILDEKCGLQGKSQGSYLDGDLWDFSPLPHFSLKAESPQVKVSIVVPVFNTQPHITRCLDSLISQSLRDIEIIIVDDCGSDGAMSIAQEFAARDPRIHILRNLKNLGLLHTRCAGAAMARGEYILYVDSDDYIKPNLCELCYERARESKADMVVFGSECKGFYRYVYQPKGSRIYTGSALSKLIFPARSKFSPYLWNKLYKRELIAKADSIISRVAGPITLAEDVLKAFVLLHLSSTAATLPQKLYIYCANASSSTSSCKDRAQSRAKALEDIRAYGRVAQALAFCASELGAYESCRLYDKFDRVLRYLVLCKRAQAGGYISNMWASLFVWFRIESLAKIMLYILSFGKIAR